MAFVVDLRGEKDIEQLRAVAIAQRTQIELLVQSLREALKNNPEALQQALLDLEEQARKAPRVKSSEDEEAEEESAPSGTAKERKRRTKFGNTEQTKLDIVPLVCTLDEADKVCPCCGGVLHPMEGQFETSEMIDVVDIRYEVKTVKQQKYVCNCGGAVETAPGPERATPGSRYSLAFAIHIAIAKYLDHIPLARQERIMRRCGLEITTQTLWDLLNGLGSCLEKTNDALLKRALDHDIIGLDQTGWKRLERKGKPWQMWCVTAPDIVVHRIREDKSAKSFVAFVGDFEGTIVCDAASTHDAGVDDAARPIAEGGRDNKAIVLAGCWAHVFRRFKEAAPDHAEANFMMEWIQKLYAIDARATDLEMKAQLRRTESKEVLETMRAWLWAQAPLESLSIGKAARYTVNNWERLTRFIDDPRIPLDSSARMKRKNLPRDGRREGPLRSKRPT